MGSDLIVFSTFAVKKYLKMGKFKVKRMPPKQTVGTAIISRKQKRKDKRKNKKVLKHNYFMKKHGKESVNKIEGNENVVDQKNQGSKSQPNQKPSAKSSSDSVQKLKKASENKRKK